ncbi:MAG: DUF6263 family protein [Ignavibacteria bacterium]|nr:DUF6263 family protein [Ignavibacteria bacterium]
MKSFLVLIVFSMIFISCETKKLADEKKLDSTRVSVANKEQVGDGSINLVLNPQLGNLYRFESRLEQKIVQKMDTVSAETKHNQLIKYTLIPLMKDSLGNFLFEAKFSEIEQEIHSKLISVSASTKKVSKEPTPLELFYNSLVGKGFRFKVNNKGRNIQLIGVDSLFNIVIEQLQQRKEFKGVDKALLQQIIGSFFNANELRKGFEKLFEVYPDNLVKLGEKWEIQKNVNDPIPAKIVNTFTLKSVQIDTLFVDLVSNIQFEKQKTKENEPKLVELSGKQNGLLIINKVTGLMLSSKLQQQISIIYQVPPSTQTNNKAINIQTKISSNFYLKLY